MIVFELSKNMTIHFSHKCPNTLRTWLISEKVHPDFAFLRATLISSLAATASNSLNSKYMWKTTKLFQ